MKESINSHKFNNSSGNTVYVSHDAFARPWFFFQDISILLDSYAHRVTRINDRPQNRGRSLYLKEAINPDIGSFHSKP